MTRTTDLEHREALANRITDYVLEHGLADLSIRPLARAVGLAPRTLLYHFGSKEAIVAEVFRRIRSRQRLVFDSLRRSELHGPVQIARAAIEYMTSERMLPVMCVFFELYALAAREPQRAPGFLESAVDDWLEFFADPVCSGTSDPARARVIATVLLGGYRGFMLDYIATRDTSRIRDAMEAWILAVQTLIVNKGVA